MGDDAGTLRLTIPEGKSFSFGTITRISESFHKSGSTTPIPSQDARNAFTIESKTAKVITISFSRSNPVNATAGGSNSLLWNNATWVSYLEKAVNRWQCKTDGFSLTYEPAADNPYVAPIDENGYISNLTISYAEGKPTLLTGSFEFHIGTMYVSSKAPSTDIGGRAQSAFQAVLYDSGNTTPYPILGDGKGCVDSYTLYGGPEYPFEYARLTIPRKKLAQTAPRLFTGQECDIKAGRNKLILNAVGSCNMTVAKVKLSSDTYTITAYCDAERIRGAVLENGATYTPLEWINQILSGGRYITPFAESAKVFKFDKSLSETCGSITFKEGTNVWYILQVVCMCMGARVFFANNKVYIIDYRSAGSPLKSMGDIDLHPSASNALYSAACLSKPDLGDEGVDTIQNALTLNCATGPSDSSGNTQTTQFTYRDEASIAVFGERASGTMYINELKQSPTGDDTGDESGAGKVTGNGLDLSLEEVKVTFYVGDKFSYDGIVVSYQDDEGQTVEVPPADCEVTEPDMSKEGVKTVEVKYGDKSASYTIAVTKRQYTQGRFFAENYVSYRSEPQQSVTFTLKEMRMQNGTPTWMPYFDPASVASSIRDDVNDIYVDNISDVTKEAMPQKLVLSSYTRKYPSGNTEYSWGVMSSIDLSTSTSQITTGLSNVKNT